MGSFISSGDFAILKPVDPTCGNRRRFFDYCNRGNKRMLQFFNDAPASNDPHTLAHAGNGFLMRRGYTVVWLAWHVEIELPGLFRVNALMLGEEDLLKRFARGQFVKGDEKLAVGALRKGFDLILPRPFLEEAEAVVAFEEIEESLDLGGGKIGDADEFRREILGDGAAVGAPVGIALRADNDERQLPRSREFEQGVQLVDMQRHLVDEEIDRPFGEFLV